MTAYSFAIKASACHACRRFPSFVAAVVRLQAQSVIKAPRNLPNVSESVVSLSTAADMNAVSVAVPVNAKQQIVKPASANSEPFTQLVGRMMGSRPNISALGPAIAL
jgi:hypothetical protein